MAVYKIFPEKDSFIFSNIIAGNAGKDEILEISSYPDLTNTGQTRRLLIKFSDTDIQHTINDIIGNTNFTASLDLYLAEASEVPIDFTIHAYPIWTPGINWSNGTGKYGDLPTNTTGVSWQSITNNPQTTWYENTGSWGTGVIGYYSGSLVGGGLWITGSNGTSYEANQEFTLNSNLDISIDVTNATVGHYTGAINNQGFIVKLQNSLEFNTNSFILLKYFGGDTNTIYPPSLTFKWNDSEYNTGSLSTLSTDRASVIIVNNKGKYVDSGKQRFRITARPTHPTRTFVTSSIYLTNYALPEETYYGLKDEYTNEMVIDFDRIGTKVSCDETGPYFDIYMGGLQPERYYRVLIKTTIDNSTVLIDSDNTFKVVQYV